MSRVKQWPVIVHPYGQSYARDRRRSALQAANNTEQASRTEEAPPARVPARTEQASRAGVPSRAERSSRGEHSSRAEQTSPAVPSVGTDQSIRTGETSSPSLVKSQRIEQVRGTRTTGIFRVPSDTVIQLIVGISSFAEDEQTAAVRISRVADGGLQPVFFRALRIPAGGAEQIVVDGLGGEMVAVEVMLPSDDLVPTTAVTQFFPADGGILVLVYKSPGDFIPV